MSRQHDVLLRNLCGTREDTFAKAKSILHTVSIKTGPGTGYDLGQGASGLAAVCAYIAAEQVGDDGISERVAQVASCLKPRLFKTTLTIVRGALAAAEAALTPRKRRVRGVSYEQLLEDHRFGRRETIMGWMRAAEQRLLENMEMRRRFGKAENAVVLAVFCWTCRLMTGKAQKVDADALLKEHGVFKDLFDEITDALHELVKDVAKTIKKDIASLRSQSSTRPAKVTRASAPVAIPREPSQPPAPPTPSRASVTRTPSKSALRAPSVDLSPNKTPSHKRKVAFDGPILEEDEEEFDALATPSKKQKFSSPLKPLPSTPTTSRVSTRLAAVAAGRASREAEAEAEQLLSVGPSTPRRTRTAPSQPSSTHSNRSGRSSRSHAGASGSAPSTPRRKPALPTVHEEPEVRRRRFRPVFADQQQWLKGDSRLEREMKPWTERWRELVKSADGDVWKAAAAGRAGARNALSLLAA